MLFGHFARVVHGLGPTAREVERERITVEVFGRARSWSEFGDPEVDRMKQALLARLDPANIRAGVAVVQYEERDAAQAAHEPDVRSGRHRRRPRSYASRYEQHSEADDPGERQRLCWFIGRLFQPDYIRAICTDRWDTAAWKEMPLPQLIELRDLLRQRLSKWLTRHKASHDFGFSIASRNPRSISGLLTNEELISELLQRGVPVPLQEPHHEPVDAPF